MARPDKRARARGPRVATLATLAALALAAGLFLWLRAPGGKRLPEQFGLDRQPALGAADAPVTVVEFADFKCPYCRVFEATVFPRLEREYITSGRVRFYFINVPFLGPDSVTAAAAGEAVFREDPAAFWRYYRAVFARQGDEDTVWATAEFLVDLIRREVPGVDADRIARRLADGADLDAIRADLEIVRRVGVTGVPALFVNGRAVPDWSYDALRAAIEAVLAGSGR